MLSAPGLAQLPKHGLNSSDCRHAALAMQQLHGPVCLIAGHWMPLLCQVVVRRLMGGLKGGQKSQRSVERQMRALTLLYCKEPQLLAACPRQSAVYLPYCLAFGACPLFCEVL